jgi:hypothetical protein
MKKRTVAALVSVPAAAAMFTVTSAALITAAPNEMTHQITAAPLIPSSSATVTVHFSQYDAVIHDAVYGTDMGSDLDGTITLSSR